MLLITGCAKIWMGISTRSLPGMSRGGRTHDAQPNNIPKHIYRSVRTLSLFMCLRIRCYCVRDRVFFRHSLRSEEDIRSLFHYIVDIRLPIAEHLL